MARPQVADGGDDLQIWKVAVNILTKQWRTADLAWGLGMWITNVTKGLGTGRILWINDLVKENGHEIWYTGRKKSV
jgi:hypothetical protein